MKIGNQDYREILFLDKDSTLLGWITDEHIIERDGVKVVMVENDSKSETLFQEDRKEDGTTDLTVLFASIGEEAEIL